MVKVDVQGMVRVEGREARIPEAQIVSSEESTARNRWTGKAIRDLTGKTALTSTGVHYRKRAEFRRMERLNTRNASPVFAGLLGVSIDRRSMQTSTQPVSLQPMRVRALHAAASVPAKRGFPYRATESEGPWNACGDIPAHALFGRQSRLEVR